MKKLLFIAENVTLAQVVRLRTLAAGLDRSRYEIHFASSAFDPMVFDGFDAQLHHIETIDKHVVEKALAAGKRVYEKKTLLRYVRADLALIDRVTPDLIVGDFRLSLCISGPVSGVPHAALINAYWSPYRAEATFPVPDHPIIRVLGEQLTEQYFPRALPKVFEHFAAPVNAVRQRYGLERIGSLQQVLTYGTYALFPDVPGLVPTTNLPSHQLYLGPVLWSPSVSWDDGQLEGNEPLVYVTLGSSGKIEVLPAVLRALAPLPVRTIVATANRANLGALPDNVRVYPFVPGHLLARRAAVVVSNGGSTTGYQAISEGKPVLGIASNLDQYLAMQAIERAGAGILVKGRNATQELVERGIHELLTNPCYTSAAQALRAEFERFPAQHRFASFTESATSASRAAKSRPEVKLALDLPAVDESAGD